MLSNRKKHILALTGSVVFCFAVFICAELWTRHSRPFISKLELYAPQSNFEAQTRHLWGEQIFEGDALLGWKLMPDLKDVFWDFTTITTNKQSMRYPEDIGRKNENEFRVLAMGDSVTFGYRVPVSFPSDPDSYIREQLAYPLLLEADLKKIFPEKNVKVIPMAVPGYTTHQGLAWLKRDIDRYDPDLITILFGWNDQEKHPMPDKTAIPSGGLKVLARNLVSNSQFLIYFSRWVYGKTDPESGPGPADTIPRVSADDFTANILEMASLAGKHGAKVVIIGPVFQDLTSNAGQGKNMAEYRTALRDAAVRNGINYLDIPEMTEKGYPENQKLFQEPIHPNYLGHRLIADNLLKFITKNILR